MQAQLQCTVKTVKRAKLGDEFAVSLPHIRNAKFGRQKLMQDKVKH